MTILQIETCIAALNLVTYSHFFQLNRGGQFYWWSKGTGIPRENHPYLLIAWVVVNPATI
jgi:hypothetical protein